MWRQTWGKPSTRQGIASVDGGNVSQGFDRPRIPLLPPIAQVVVVGHVVLGVVKHNGVLLILNVSIFVFLLLFIYSLFPSLP